MEPDDSQSLSAVPLQPHESDGNPLGTGALGDDGLDVLRRVRGVLLADRYSGEESPGVCGAVAGLSAANLTTLAMSACFSVVTSSLVATSRVGVQRAA